MRAEKVFRIINRSLEIVAAFGIAWIILSVIIGYKAMWGSL